MLCLLSWWCEIKSYCSVSNHRLRMSNAWMCGHSNVQFPFCSLCTEHSLPVAYFLQSAPSSVPLTEHHKATACENCKAFCPFSLSVNPASSWKTMASRFPGQCGGHKCWDKLTTTAKCWCFMIRTHGVADGGTMGVFVAQDVRITHNQKAV